MEGIFWKLAQPDGWDFYTGETINYRASIGRTVKCPEPGIIYAGRDPNDCFAGAKIPCSAYRVKGRPVVKKGIAYGFTELEILEEINDLDQLFGWKYSEIVSPLNPFNLPRREITEEDVRDLIEWISIKIPIGETIRNTLENSRFHTMWVTQWYRIWTILKRAVSESVKSIFRNWLERASVREVIWAYIGSLFPLEVWPESMYPFSSGARLWKWGLVPSNDGTSWRLNSGKDGEIVYTIPGRW